MFHRHLSENFGCHHTSSRTFCSLFATRVGDFFLGFEILICSTFSQGGAERYVRLLLTGTTPVSLIRPYGDPAAYSEVTSNPKHRYINKKYLLHLVKHTTKYTLHLYLILKLNYIYFKNYHSASVYRILNY